MTRIVYTNGPIVFMIHLETHCAEYLAEINSSSLTQQIKINILMENNLPSILEMITRANIKVSLQRSTADFDPTSLCKIIENSTIISELTSNYVPSSIEAFKEFTNSLRKNSSLKSITFSHLDETITESNFKYFIDTLLNHQSINEIEFELENLSEPSQFEFFKQSLISSKTIESISFHYSLTETNALQDLFNGLQKNDHLKQLRISFDEDMPIIRIVEEIKKFVSENKSIQVFHTSYPNSQEEETLNLSEILPALENNYTLTDLMIPFSELEHEESLLTDEELADVNKFRSILKRNNQLLLKKQKIEGYQSSLQYLKNNLNKSSLMECFGATKFNALLELSELMEMNADMTTIQMLYQELYKFLIETVRSYGAEQFEELAKLYVWNQQNFFSDQDNFFLNLNAENAKSFSDIHTKYEKEFFTAFAFLISTGSCDHFFPSFENKQFLSSEDNKLKQNLIIALTWKNTSSDATCLKHQALAALLANKDKKDTPQSSHQIEEIINKYKGSSINKVISLDDLNESMCIDNNIYRKFVISIQTEIQQGMNICILEQIMQEPTNPIKFLTLNKEGKLDLTEFSNYQSTSQLVSLWLENIEKAYPLDNGTIEKNTKKRPCPINIVTEGMDKDEINPATVDEFSEWVGSFQSTSEHFLTNIKTIESNHLSFINYCHWNTTNQFHQYHKEVYEAQKKGLINNMITLTDDYLEKFKEHYCRFKTCNQHMIFNSPYIRSNLYIRQFVKDIENEIEQFKNQIQNDENPNKLSKLEA